MVKFILLAIFIIFSAAPTFAAPKAKFSPSIVNMFSQKVKFHMSADWKVIRHHVNKQTYELSFIAKGEQHKNFKNMFAIISFKNFAIVKLNNVTIL